ncbi:MAG: metallophosphoesterase, partial [Anaerolineales bacterium]
DTSAPATPPAHLVFAVIGDYGEAGPHALAVAEMIEDWNVDFIVTTGDNNYPNGEAETIDENIGQYYHHYIGSYQGIYGAATAENRFFPTMGNHDWTLDNSIEPYLDYFTLPGNERYYEVVVPPVHFFIIDSDTREPDGVGASSDQAAWLREALENSTQRWQIIVMHHPPYSSGRHGSTDYMQWPFEEWGAEVVLAGHDHLYERLEVDDVLYLISGLGGHEARYAFVEILPQSQFRYNEDWGALRVTATEDWILFEFINVSGKVIDSVVLEREIIFQPE